MRSGSRRLTLALLHGAAVWATARSQDAGWVWLLAAPGVATAAGFQIALGARLRTALRQASHATFLVVVAFGAGWVLYPLMPDSSMSRASLLGGITFLILSALQVLDRERRGPATGLLLASVGAFLAAALDPRAQLALPLLLGFVALAASLALDLPGFAPWSLGLSLASALFLAWVQVRLLPWAQPQVEAAVASALNPAAGLAGFGQGATLGDIAALSLSRRVALRVHAQRPRKLRGQVLTRFDGRSWTLPVPLEGVPMPMAALPGGGPAWLPRPGSAPTTDTSERVTILPASGGTTLFAPAWTSHARATSGQLRWQGAGVLTSDESPGAYELLVSAAAPAAEGGPCDECLTLPARLDPRLPSLAQELSAGSSDPRARVERTLQYLARHYRYSLEPGRFHTTDPLAEFLFDKRRGYCEYFASAAAVLLRLQGLETRYVKGFNVTPEQRIGDHYLVRESAAHAWIDVRWPGNGWSEWDPTPAADYAAAHGEADLGLWSGVWEAGVSLLGRARLALAHAGVSRSGWLLAGGMAVGLVLMWARRRLRMRRQRVVATLVRPPWPRDLQHLVALLDADCARRGSARPPSRGLLDHLASLRGERFPADWHRSSAQVAERLYAATYGGVILSPDELRSLERRLSKP